MPHLASGADEVRVIEGAGFDPRKRSSNKQLIALHDADEVARLVSMVTTWKPGEPQHWMEWPAVSVVLLQERRLLAEFGLLAGGHWVRTPDGDREIDRPEALLAWLARHGVQMT